MLTSIVDAAKKGLVSAGNRPPELRHPELGIPTPLIVDATGPGEVFLDFLRGSAILLMPVNITAAGAVPKSTVAGTSPNPT